MPNLVSLPIEFDRKFSIQLYWASHGLLLLRSYKTNSDPKRIDLLFSDVRWMNLPVWLEGIRIERCSLEEIPTPLTAKIKEEVHFMSVFKLISQDVSHYLIAGENVSIAHDDNDYAGNSSLLPYLDFTAFKAPLWKE